MSSTAKLINCFGKRKKAKTNNMIKIVLQKVNLVATYAPNACTNDRSNDRDVANMSEEQKTKHKKHKQPKSKNELSVDNFVMQMNCFHSFVFRLLFF